MSLVDANEVLRAGESRQVGVNREREGEKEIEKEERRKDEENAGVMAVSGVWEKEPGKICANEASTEGRIKRPLMMVC